MNRRVRPMITIAQVEFAINHWRTVCPASGEERTLSPEVNALADLYAIMIFQHKNAVDPAVLSDKQKAALLAIERA